MLTMKGIILLVILGVASAQLDLKRSISRIQDQIQESRENPADWSKLPGIIKAALPCLNSLSGLFEVEGGQLPTGLQQYIESITPTSIAQDLLEVDWAKVSAKRSDIAPTNIWDDLNEFMNTTEFKTIHDHIWNNEEFIDLVTYLRDANYADIFDLIKKFYTDNGREDLAEDVHPAPPTYPVQPTQTERKLTNAPKATSNNIPVITKKSTIFKQDDPQCSLNDILGLLNMLSQSGIQHVIKIFLYALQEFIGNGAMHVLAMKLGESYKGDFFGSTLALPEMEQFLPLVNRAILAEPGFAQLNEILRQVTGLDIGNMELFKYIVNLLQYLLWNHPFPDA